MKGFKTRFTMAAFGLVLSGSAHAATLVTGDASSQINAVYCDVVNTRNVATTVTIEAYNWSGTLIGSLTKTLQANQGASMKASDPLASYCKFIAPTKRSIVAMAVVHDPVSGDYISISPAQ